MSNNFPVPQNPKGCRKHEDCDRNHMCVNLLCLNPCQVNTHPCGVAAKCILKNRKLSCKCPDGWHGDPLDQCFKEKNHTCSEDHHCTTDLSCTNGFCIDPCEGREVCGMNARCEVVKHLPHCYCMEGWMGNPEVHCYLGKSSCLIILCNWGNVHRFVSGDSGNCSKNSECHEERTCVKRRCKNLCDTPFACGTNAICKTVNHKQTCKCKEKWYGDPKVRCELRCKYSFYSTSVCCLRTDEAEITTTFQDDLGVISRM